MTPRRLELPTSDEVFSGLFSETFPNLRQPCTISFARTPNHIALLVWRLTALASRGPGRLFAYF